MMTKPIRGKTIMGQPILEVQLSVTMTPYEAVLKTHKKGNNKHLLFQIT